MSAEEPVIDSADIVAMARANDSFRQVVMTGPLMQIVLMTLAPGEEIGEETHPDVDQMLFFVDGDGEAILDGESSEVSAGRLVLVRSGVRHNFVNTGDRPLRLVTAYAPPEHPVGTVHETKAEADEAEHDH